ncbi:MAG TPA: addiction module protein [Burkholderiales bacterium]|nr:addiction module protein [Burkholderiales bacterium]
MTTIVELEKAILALPASEREQLAAAAWESLVNDPNAASTEIDPEGLRVAAERDVEIETGRVQAIDQEEFLRRTDGASG